MKMKHVARQTWNLGFLDSVSLTRSQSATAAIFLLITFTFVTEFLHPPLGTLLMEIGFPILAIGLLCRKTPDFFNPAFFFPPFYLLWCWIGSIPLIRNSGAIRLFDAFDDKQWLFYLTAFTAFWFGSLLIKFKNGNLSMLHGVTVPWREYDLFLFFGILAFVILLSWGVITASEGIPILHADVETARDGLPSRHHMAYQALIGTCDLMLPLIFLYLWTTRAPRLRGLLYCFSIFIVFALISQGSRGLVLPAGLTVIVMRHYLVKRWSLRALFIPTLAVVLLVSVSGYYRSIQHFGPGYALDLLDMGIPISLQPITNIYLYVRAPLDTFRQVVKLIPSMTPFQHGALSFGFVLQLLPGRHPSSDFFFKDLLGDVFAGFGEPASILGPFYADFGMTGVILGMFLTGLMSKLIYIRMFRGSLGWLVAYCFLCQKLIASLYGSLFSYVIEILLPIAWILSVRVLTRGANPEP